MYMVIPIGDLERMQSIFELITGIQECVLCTEKRGHFTVIIDLSKSDGKAGLIIISQDKTISLSMICSCGIQVIFHFIWWKYQSFAMMEYLILQRTKFIPIQSRLHLRRISHFSIIQSQRHTMLNTIRMIWSFHSSF